MGRIPILPIFVGFNGQAMPDERIRSYLGKIFGATTSADAYMREISYGSLTLGQEKELSIPVYKDPSVFSWGYGEFEVEKARELTLSVFEQVLLKFPDINVQDKVILLVLDASSTEIQGRGAMCLVPGVVLNPAQGPPENQELFIGHPPLHGPPYQPSRRTFFIDSDYSFSTYYGERKDQFDSYSDQFVRGVCIFCKDAILSCAVHDIIHALRRISAGLPTDALPGARARAVPCLYNLFLQTYWLGQGEVDRSVYCAPYVGWWDNTGDHLHCKLPRPFFSCYPYGVTSFTKARLDLIPSSYLRTATQAQESFHLAPLAGDPLPGQLPPQVSGWPVLVVKVPLSGEATPVEYLLVEYRRPVAGSVDDVSVDVNGMIGDPADDPGYTNPPEHLVSDSGVLVYHVNEAKSHLGRDVGNVDITSNPILVRDFIAHVYTSSMMVGTWVPDWSQRTRQTLKTAAFKPGGKSFKLGYPLNAPTLGVEITVDSMNDHVADITVKRIKV